MRCHHPVGRYWTLAETFWYLAAGCLGACTVVQLLSGLVGASHGNSYDTRYTEHGNRRNKDFLRGYEICARNYFGSWHSSTSLTPRNFCRPPPPSQTKGSKIQGQKTFSSHLIWQEAKETVLSMYVIATFAAWPRMQAAQGHATAGDLDSDDSPNALADADGVLKNNRGGRGVRR